MIEQAAPGARAVVGMSLGGSTTIRLAASRRDLVRRAVIVNVAPTAALAGRAGPGRGAGGGSPGQRAAHLRVVRGDGGRRRRREPQPSPVGGRAWRPAQRPAAPRWALDLALRPVRRAPGAGQRPHRAVGRRVRRRRAAAARAAPTRPFRGNEDVAEFQRRLPAAQVEVVPGAGHAVQSDQPLALARLIEEFDFWRPEQLLGLAVAPARCFNENRATDGTRSARPGPGSPFLIDNAGLCPALSAARTVLGCLVACRRAVGPANLLPDHSPEPGAVAFLVGWVAGWSWVRVWAGRAASSGAVLVPCHAAPGPVAEPASPIHHTLPRRRRRHTSGGARAARRHCSNTTEKCVGGVDHYD